MLLIILNKILIELRLNLMHLMHFPFHNHVQCRLQSLNFLQKQYLFTSFPTFPLHFTSSPGPTCSTGAAEGNSFVSALPGVLTRVTGTRLWWEFQRLRGLLFSNFVDVCAIDKFVEVLQESEFASNRKLTHWYV